MKNAKNRRFVREYAQNIIRLNKTAELFLWNQLLQIWNDLEIDFQLLIFKLTKNTRMSDFLRLLNDKKNAWWKLNEREESNRRRKSESIKNNNVRNKDQRDDRQQQQSQFRDMLAVDNIKRQVYNQQFDEYNNEFFRSDISSAFISAQFFNFVFQSNFIFQSNFASQNYVNQAQQSWYQNRAYVQQQQAEQATNAQQQQSILSFSSSRKQLTTDSNQNQKDQSKSAFDFIRRSLIKSIQIRLIDKHCQRIMLNKTQTKMITSKTVQ